MSNILFEDTLLKRKKLHFLEWFVSKFEVVKIRKKVMKCAVDDDEHRGPQLVKTQGLKDQSMLSPEESIHSSTYLPRLGVLAEELIEGV